MAFEGLIPSPGAPRWSIANRHAPAWIRKRRIARRRRARENAAAGMPPETFSPRRILIVTDAWRPQVNGVVRTLESLAASLRARGFEVKFITPDMFRSAPLPSYPEIRLALFAGRKVREIIEAFEPDAIHIATEGTLGLAARRYCVRHGVRFSTAFHTRYPDYIHARFRVPHKWIWSWLRWFHRPAINVMAPTPTMKACLEEQGFANARV